MSDKFTLDAAGFPVPCDDTTEWGRWFQTAENRSVGRTTLDDGSEVSTVFLGLDHNLEGRGKPILWETLVFGGPLDGEMFRYETRLQAERGHIEMVAKVKAAIAPQGTRQIDLE